MLDILIDRLQKRSLTGWQIREITKISLQSFLAGEERECERTVETVRYVIEVFQKQSAEKMGMAEFTIVPENMNDFDRYLDEALFASSLVSNQPFELPEKPNHVEPVELADPNLSRSTLLEFEDRLRGAIQKEKDTRLSSAEFFINLADSRLINHRGLDLTQKETIIQSEIILLSKSGKRENEFINRTKRRRLTEYNLEKEVSESAQRARDATQATLPQTGKFPVVFSEEPLDQLFNPILARASARVKYNRLLDVEVGKSVMGKGAPVGDQLTLWSNSLIPGAIGSYQFDEYGIPGQRVCLIEKNIVKNLIADKRYADYLNIPPTGDLGNIEIEPGSKPFFELLRPRSSKPLYHIVAFSAFEPNSITGAYSAEIRAGYEISSNGIKPIKGGSVSGVIHKDLLNAVFSSERAQRERALVPIGVLFDQLTLSGEE